jgi:hypothetical protein
MEREWLFHTRVVDDIGVVSSSSIFMCDTFDLDGLYNPDIELVASPFTSFTDFNMEIVSTVDPVQDMPTSTYSAINATVDVLFSV